MDWVEFLTDEIELRSELLRFHWSALFGLATVLLTLISFVFWNRPPVDLTVGLVLIGIGGLVYVAVLQPVVRLFISSTAPLRAPQTELWQLLATWRLVHSSGLNAGSVRESVAETVGLFVGGVGLIAVANLGPEDYQWIVMACGVGLIAAAGYIFVISIIAWRSKRVMSSALAQAILAETKDVVGWGTKDAKKNPEIRELLRAAALPDQRPNLRTIVRRHNKLVRTRDFGISVKALLIVEGIAILGLIFGLSFFEADKLGADVSFGVLAIVMSSAIALCLTEGLFLIHGNRVLPLLVELRIAAQAGHVQEAATRRCYLLIHSIAHIPLSAAGSLHSLLRDSKIVGQLDGAEQSTHVGTGSSGIQE